jgi:HEXXH motif-containing protein
MRGAGDQDSRELDSFHQLPWKDFESLARGDVDVDVVRRLRHAERSRRLLLLRALLDEVMKTPVRFEPLPSLEEAWDLLARVEARAPTAFNFMLCHPYTGSWVGYTIRLLRRGITGVCPLWSHIGHMHAIAASAAIRAGLNFRVLVPVWEGNVVLPTLGLARLAADEPYSIAEVRGDCDRIEITNEHSKVVLTDPLDADAPGWSGVRRVTTTSGRQRLTVRLDDIDPYRGLHEPVLPRRLTNAESDKWRELLIDAWQLIAGHLPDLAEAFPTGVDSIAPFPPVRFRSTSASTGEAFGSVRVARPDDAATLAAALVHEFQHIVLGGILHLTRLYDDDSSERLYVPWRPDPRPLSGALTGVYAFFGVAGFWRAIARERAGRLARRAAFEFALARSQTWRVLSAIRDDATLTPAGRRFVDGITTRLHPWLDEPVPDDLVRLADAVTTDHHAGWRMRHVRPSSSTVDILSDTWLAGHSSPPTVLPSAMTVPTPVQDGMPSNARADLIRLGVGTDDRSALTFVWRSVPDATTADLSYTTGRFTEAVQGYRAELVRHPDRVSSWTGLGLALDALGSGSAARALLLRPELVRAVHRRIIARSQKAPAPEQLAAWIGHSVH